MKKLLLISIVIIGLMVAYKTLKVDAQGNTGIPLSQLAGSYALSSHGTESICFNPFTNFPATSCGNGAEALPFDTSGVGQSFQDTLGNTCGTQTNTISDLFGDTFQIPPSTSVSVGTVTNYDPLTGTGNGKFTSYTRGSCDGATFLSKGAVVNTTGTFSFTVSQGGNRSDSIVTGVTTPQNDIGSFSITGVSLRQ